MGEQVCVTGANGQTGSIVVRKLSERKAAGEAVSVVGIVRSEKSKQQLLKQLPSVDASDVKVVPGYEKDALKEAMAGCDRLVILTSAKPKLVVSSLFGVMWNKYVMQKAGVKIAPHVGSDGERISMLDSQSRGLTPQARAQGFGQ